MSGNPIVDARSELGFICSQGKTEPQMHSAKNSPSGIFLSYSENKGGK